MKDRSNTGYRNTETQDEVELFNLNFHLIPFSITKVFFVEFSDNLGPSGYFQWFLMLGKF